MEHMEQVDGHEDEPSHGRQGKIRGLGSPEERCLGQSRWLPRGADAPLILERQTNSTPQGAGRVFQAGDQHEPRPETVSTRPREGHEAALGSRMFTGGSPDGGAVRRQGTVSCRPRRSWGAPTWASSVSPAPNKHSFLWKGTSSPLKCENKNVTLKKKNLIPKAASQEPSVPPWHPCHQISVLKIR